MATKKNRYYTLTQVIIIFTILNKDTYTCQRSRIENDKKDNIQDFFINTTFLLG